MLKNYLTACLLTGTLLLPSSALAVLPVEELARVESLDVPYPEHWVFAHDATFFHMTAGRYVLLDPLAETGPQQYKGMIDAAFISAFAQAPGKREVYVAETFYSRGTRGERTDVVTIYDTANLSPLGEVVMPPGLRMSSMPQRYAAQILRDESLLLITNLNPGTSVSVIDLNERQYLATVPIPGCVLTFPTGKSGFSSLCGDGAMMTTVLDAKGEVVRTHRSKPFFDADTDPLFEKPAMIDGVAYFPTFKGQVFPVDLRREKPRIGKPWSLLSEQEKTEGWRPGGWQLNAEDQSGRFYILMHPEGYNGSHKDGGSELWVFDARKKRRLERIKLNTWGVSVSATRGKKPLLLVTNAEMGVDVYDAGKGTFLRTLNFAQQTPFLVHPVK